MTNKPKVHYTIDHVLTSCFVWAHAVDVTMERRKVTCKNCKRSRKFRTKEKPVNRECLVRSL